MASQQAVSVHTCIREHMQGSLGLLQYLLYTLPTMFAGLQYRLGGVIDGTLWSAVGTGG